MAPSSRTASPNDCAHLRDRRRLHCDADRDGLEGAHGEHVEDRDGRASAVAVDCHVADSPRIQELRRRVQQDPASLAFAPLAEELRRAGRAREAVTLCQTGLSHHPEYVSARATLGRALLDLGELDDALFELPAVLSAAPENLMALRASRKCITAAASWPRRSSRTVVPATRPAGRRPRAGDRDAGAIDAGGPSAGEVSACFGVTTAAAIDPGEDEQRGQLRRLQTFLDQILADRARRPAARA